MNSTLNTLGFPAPGGALRSPRGQAYVLGRQLGGGAFGAVFEALGPFDESFAVKVLHPGSRPYAEVRSQWLQEAQRMLAFRHPYIVYVHDYFEVGCLFVLVLERCDHTLEAMLGQPFTDRLVVDVSRQLLFALQYLHDQELVHNDLHAGNVLISQGEPLRVKLSDLGIAQELEGRPRVTPHLVQHRIMAPEVLAGGYTTKQSDLYQLGLLMYAMHTGQYPIEFHAGLEHVMDQIACGVPRARAEALGTPLGNIASVLLRRHEQYRYTSPAQVWEDLRRLDGWQSEPWASGAEPSPQGG